MYPAKRFFFINRLILFIGASLLCAPAFGGAATPYICARRAVTALSASFSDFVKLVHPVKGLSYHEAGKEINRGLPFSCAQLQAAARRPASAGYAITSSYNDEELGTRVNIAGYLQKVVRKHPFAVTKDVRRNITGLAHSTDIFNPAKRGQTLISFHLTDSANELSWYCLVVRTELYQGSYYVTGMDYLYWTP